MTIIIFVLRKSKFPAPCLKEEGLKQSDFADRVLVSASYISKVESNKEIPSEIFTKLVSLEFHISYAWLKDGSGDIHIKKDEYDYFERNVEKAANYK